MKNILYASECTYEGRTVYCTEENNGFAVFDDVNGRPRFINFFTSKNEAIEFAVDRGRKIKIEADSERFHRSLKK